MALTELTPFFGWMTVINFALMIVSVLMMTMFKGFAAGIHHKMFGIGQDDISKMHFQLMGQYKIMTFVFCAVPYLALKMMS